MISRRIIIIYICLNKRFLTFIILHDIQFSTVIFALLQFYLEKANAGVTARVAEAGVEAAVAAGVTEAGVAAGHSRDWNRKGGRNSKE